MKMKALCLLAATMPLTLLALSTAGCSEPSSGAPPPQAMTPRKVDPPKEPPKTKEDKLKAIDNAPLSPAEKEAAKKRVMEGNL